MTDLLVVLLVGTGALAQAISGIGFALVCGPVLVAALGTADGVRTAVLLSLLVNVAVLLREHRHVHWRAAVGLLVPAAVATPVLALALSHVPERVGKVLAGLAAVVGAAALARGLRWPAARSRAGLVGAAVVSAAMNDAAGIGGPAVALWADNAGWPHEKTRSTLQVYFFGLNVVALATLGLPRQPGRRYAEELAALVVGSLLGAAASRRTPAASARRVTLALAAAGGLVVLTRALL